jgi:hypothetical protein
MKLLLEGVCWNWQLQGYSAQGSQEPQSPPQQGNPDTHGQDREVHAGHQQDTLPFADEIIHQGEGNQTLAKAALAAAYIMDGGIAVLL